MHEQQAVSDVVPLKRQVKALRRLGFGFAIDDAGAGYASFALIAALRPSIIKIDRLIAAGVARDDAKQALVEAFVSFGRRIGARLLAEGSSAGPTCRCSARWASSWGRAT
jgi:EAL domain-containing protein (putative c-di-GMP-specific phosphodiesterase class I)